MVKYMKLDNLFDLEKNLNNLALKGMNDTSFCLYVNEYFKKNIVMIYRK